MLRCLAVVFAVTVAVPDPASRDRHPLGTTWAEAVLPAWGMCRRAASSWSSGSRGRVRRAARRPCRCKFAAWLRGHGRRLYPAAGAAHSIRTGD